MSTPFYAVYDGEVFRPLPQFKHRCDDLFGAGQVVRLIEEEDRSKASHDHFFAAVRDGYNNLPEHFAVRFCDEEHLRKWCLVATGWAKERNIVCETINDAAKFAAFLQSRDIYSVVVHRGRVVKEFTAVSQSYRMGKDRFQRSKQDVLDKIEGLLGVKQGSLMQQQESKIGDRQYSENRGELG